MDKATGFVRALTVRLYATPSENIGSEAWYGVGWGQFLI